VIFIRNFFSVSSSDRRAIFAWAIAALVGIVVVVRYHNEALPSAAIDFRITRGEAEALATAFLVQHGYDPAPYRKVTTFGYDDEAKVYLERELGLEAVNRLTRTDTPIWRWDTRFFRPQQQEEFSVSFSPSGRFAGFFHEIEETRPGASLSQQEARVLAERFLETAQPLPMERYRPIEAQTTDRKNRTDHSFTWERIGFTAGEATCRITVVIYGDRVGEYGEFLKIPEAWQRDYTRLRSRNELSQYIASIGMTGFVIALIFVFLRELPGRRLRWGFGVRSGVFLAIVSVALTFNLLPLALTQYETTQSLETFYSSIVLSATISAGGWFLFITLINTTGSHLYREHYPDRLSPEWLFSGRALRTGEYVSSSLIGYLIPCVMLGYITAFYLIAGKFGAWSPAGVDYTDMASTSLPWLYPLSIGLQASLFEEGLFRLFAIPFLQRYLKSTFWAVLIPAVCWGFLHSSYPQQPFFIRGVELSVVGVMLGYVFLRRGILCTLIAHYVFDALVLSLFLFQSSRPYFQMSGALVVGIMMIPLIPALIAWRRGYPVNDPALTGGADKAQTDPLELERTEVKPSSEIPSPTDVSERSGFATQPAPPLTTSRPGRRVWIVWTAGVAGAILMATVPVERFLDFVDVRIDRTEAIHRAEAYLHERGTDVSGFERVASFSTASGSPGHLWNTRYIREHAGVGALNQAYRERLSPAVWVVRFFRPFEKEEYRVTVDRSGKIAEYDHVVDESAPGDSLSAAAALIPAATAAAEREPRFDAYRLIESEQERRPARIDHFFVWEDSLNPIAEGHFRLQTMVQGGEAVQTRVLFKPPEVWVRRQQERTGKDIALLVGGIVGAGLIGALMVLIFIDRLRTRAIDWKFGLYTGAGLAAFSMLARLNELSSRYVGYETTESPETFLIQRLLAGFVVGPAVLMLAGALLAGFTESVYRMTYPERMDIATWFRAMLRNGSTAGRPIFRDALILAGAACLLVPGLRHALDLWMAVMGADAGLITRTVPYTDTFFPAVSAFLNALSSAVTGGALLLALWLFIRHYGLRRHWIPGLLLLTVLIFQADAARTTNEFVAGTLRTLVFAGVAGLCMRYVWRDNLLAGVLTIFLVSLTSDAWTMITGSTGVYRVSGIATFCFALVPLLVGFWWFYLRKDKKSNPTYSASN